jgi:hypothetical protein
MAFGLKKEPISKQVTPALSNAWTQRCLSAMGNISRIDWKPSRGATSTTSMLDGGN